MINEIFTDLFCLYEKTVHFQSDYALSLMRACLHWPTSIRVASYLDGELIVVFDDGCRFFEFVLVSVMRGVELFIVEALSRGFISVVDGRKRSSITQRIEFVHM
jgi:hypothetical protein